MPSRLETRRVRGSSCPGRSNRTPETLMLGWRSLSPLYVSELRGDPVDLALAASDDLTLLVVLSTRDDERDAMYEAVYLPVIDALEPIE